MKKQNKEQKQNAPKINQNNSFSENLKKSIEKAQKEAEILAIEKQKEEHAGEVADFLASELLDDSVEEVSDLVKGLLAKGILACLAGSSDNGKSALARQLCACVVTGKDFLSWKVTPTYHRAVYISTEDDKRALKKNFISLQNNELQLNKEELGRIRFIVETDNILAHLDELLSKESADIVILDTFTDVFFGELYQANKVREFFIGYHKLCLKYGCSILIITHTNKRSEDLRPDKNNITGSQAIEAKMRLVCELRTNKGNLNKKYLCILKANYLEPNDKQYAYDLSFNGNLIFTATGTRTPFERINFSENNFDEQERDYNDIMQMREQRMKWREIASKYAMSETAIIKKVKRYEQKLDEIERQEKELNSNIKKDNSNNN